MKRLFAYLIVVLAISDAAAQHEWIINNVWIQPAQPTTVDTVTLYASGQMPNSWCYPLTSVITPGANTIHIHSVYYMGWLTALCPFTDSATTGPLAAGTYQVFYRVSDSSHFSWDEDTLQFTVQTPTAIALREAPAFTIRHFPDHLLIFGDNLKAFPHAQLVLTDLRGRTVSQRHFTGSPPLRLSTSGLAPGLYLLQIWQRGKWVGVEKVVR